MNNGGKKFTKIVKFKKNNSSHESLIENFGWDSFGKQDDWDSFVYTQGFFTQSQFSTRKNFQGMLPSLTNDVENQIEKSVIILPEQQNIANSTKIRAS